VVPGLVVLGDRPQRLGRFHDPAPTRPARGYARTATQSPVVSPGR
jgi:hypothetical protein